MSQTLFKAWRNARMGFLVVGYIKETHEKIRALLCQGYCACKDALTFFGHPVETWMDFTSDGEEEE